MIQVKEGEIYRHNKTGHLYKIDKVGYHHEDSDELAVILYSRCDENGIFQSIRIQEGGEETVPQPFWRFHDEFVELVRQPTKEGIKMVKRFEKYSKTNTENNSSDNKSTS